MPLGAAHAISYAQCYYGNALIDVGIYHSFSVPLPPLYKRKAKVYKKNSEHSWRLSVRETHEIDQEANSDVQCIV